MNNIRVTSDQISEYFEGDVIENALTAKFGEGFCFPIRRFVSYNNETSVLRVLVAGPCQATNGCEHMRNVYSAEFCSLALGPLVKNQFEMIEKIVPVSTYDADLEDIVRRFGYNLVLKNEIGGSMFDIYKILSEQHPDVDSFMKLIWSGEGQIISVFNDHLVNSTQFISRYSIGWLIDENYFKICTTAGNFVQGYTGLKKAIEEGDAIHPSFTIISENGKKYLLATGNSTYQLKIIKIN